MTLVKELRTRVRQLEAGYDTLRTELARREKRIEMLKTKLGECEKTIEQLHSRISELVAAIAQERITARRANEQSRERSGGPGTRSPGT